MAERTMGEFWDERAREDPFFFVDNRLEYKAGDVEEFWRGGPEGLELMLGALGESFDAGDEVVEIGCGLGRMTRAIAGQVASVRAVDVSREMLDRAAELNAHLANVTWVHGDGASLAGIEDASADCCYSDVVFQHIPDPAITLRYVAEIGRVLRPGGWSAFQISNLPEIHAQPLKARVRTRLRELLGSGPKGQAHPAWLGSAVDLGDLRRVCGASGLTVEKTVGEGTQYCRVLLRRG